MAADMKMTRARALDIMKRESAHFRAFWPVVCYVDAIDFADALDLAVADMEKVLRRQKLMKRDLIRRAKARKEAAQ